MGKMPVAPTVEQTKRILEGKLNHGFLVYKNAEDRVISYSFVMENGIPRLMTEGDLK